MNKFRLLLAAAYLLGLSACATSVSPEAQKVIETSDEKIVQGCTHLGEVRGTSNVGGLLFTTGKENAMNEAIEKAAQRGATHILWKRARGLPLGGSAEGVAYRCGQ